MLQFNLLSLGLILCTSLGLVAAWFLRTKFLLYGLPVLITLIVGAYFDSFEDDGYVRFTEETASINSELPPVVHILLDSFIGIDGLPPYPASKMLSEELYAFFDKYNFQVYPRAYSRFLRTGDSLYSALNFRNKGDSVFGMEVLGRHKHILRSNSQFDVMQRLGYRFNIYQTEYLDFCKSNPDHLGRCWDYAQPNVDTIQFVQNRFSQLKMLTSVLVGQSTLLSSLLRSRDWLPEQGVAYYDPRVFSNLENDLLRTPRGKYFFAHVLLPHGPFVYMHDCSINYESPLWARYAGAAKEIVNNDEIYEIRTMKYFEQIDCAMKSVGKIFESMKMAGIYEQSVIVVHGDHGSLIGKSRPVYENLGLLTPAEYRSNFSTLFAVKFPGQEGRVDHRVLPLSTLMEEFSTTVQVHISGQEEPTFMKTLPDSPEKVNPYVYLQGTIPMWRVDINIFED
jgi:hypothetical protein